MRLSPSPRRRLARGGAFAALTAGAVLAASLASAPVHATTGTRAIKHTYHPRRGLSLTTIHYGGPIEVRVLRFIPRAGKNGFTVEPGAPGPVLSTHAKPSTIAANQGAIAAINGDFGLDGQPAHFNALDGDVRTSGFLSGSGFAISKDEKFAYAERPKPAMILVASDGDTFKVTSWNAGQPNNNQVAGFTKAGGSRQAPGQDQCYVRLINATGRSWSSVAKAGVRRTWDIGQRTCQHTPITVGSDPGNVVLTGKQGTGGADLVSGLPNSGTVTITWKIPSWPGIVEAIGGQPVIVDAGVNVGPPRSSGSSYFYKPNPRSAIGITRGCSDADTTTRCKVIYMTVDGRQDGWSVGMTLDQLGAEMIKYGAYYAVNIDGGGGTVMWLKDTGPWCITYTNGGCLVDKPADSSGGERATLSAMLVLAGRDTNEPTIAPYSTSAPVPSTWMSPFGPAVSDSGTDWDALALSDPASTGGLLDSLADRGTLPQDLRPLLRVYRSDPST